MHRADDFQPLDPAAAAARDAVQFELRQAELGARQLAVIAGRLLGGAAIGGAGLLRATRCFRRAALPIAGTRERGRIGAADADAGEMLRGDRRVLQEAQRNPARGEFLLGLVDVARRKCCVPRNQVGVAVFADVEHLARQQAPLDPPFVEIVQTVRIFRRRQHELRGLLEFLFAAKPLDPGEHVAGVAVQFARHRIEQRLEVGGFLVGRNARLGQRDMARAQPFGRAHAAGFLLGAVQQRVHPRLVVARRQQRTELVDRSDFGVFRHAIVAPGLAHQPFGIGAIAARDHDLRQRELALGGDRRLVFEPRPDCCVVAAVVPQRGLDAPAQERLRRPARIGGDKRAVALDRSAVVVAAQDQPFRELAGDRIGDRGLRLRGVGGLLLAHELDDVFQHVLVGLRGRGRRGYRRGRHDLFARGRQGGVLARRGGQYRRRRCRGGRRRGGRGGGAYLRAGSPSYWRPYSPSAWERRCGRSAAASAAELSTWPRPPRGGRTARSPAPGSWPVRSIEMRLRGRKGSRLSSAAANHSIAQALDLFD